MEFIVTTKEELAKIVRETVSAIISENLGTSAEEPDTMNIDQAVKYLNAKGYSIRKSSIYKLTAKGEIPFLRFGERKVMFRRKELDLWIEERTKKVI